MARPDDSVSLSALARLGFAELSEAAASLSELATILDQPRSVLLEAADAADPDAAVRGLLHVARRDATPLRSLLGDEQTRRRVWRVFGASEGFAEFFLRHPEQLSVLQGPVTGLPSADELQERLLASVGARDGFAESGDDDA
ncbi:MAG: bifunctional [glutamine synthetase] adenylyltransferase/[glutamine synthetase]-adenylyl-L-tyrosine phosphorylase, partial [Microbacterium sp.]